MNQGTILEERLLAASGDKNPHSSEDAPQIEQVVVIHDYAVPEGGAGVLALESVKQYRDLGYPVTFVTGQGPTPELEALGVTVLGLGSQGLLERPAAQAFRQGLHNSQANRLLARWIARHDRPGVVYHLHNWSQVLSPAIFHALRPVEDRTIVTCHDFFNACPNGSFLHYGQSKPCDLRPLSAACLLSQCDRRNAAHKYWRAVRQFNLNRIARFASSQCTFTFIHERMRDRFVQGGFAARDLEVIPNPAKPWCDQRIEAERNEGFLFVGRVGRDKGADIAIEAAGQAGQKITLVGTGELSEGAATQHPHANFAGWCNREEIARHARHARALIVPSRVVEPFGLVICEAAMSGLPVIVSDRAYLSGDVEACGFGCSFDVSDTTGLARLLDTTFRDDRIVERMSRRAVKSAASLCHTPESWISAYVDIFRRKLRKP